MKNKTQKNKKLKIFSRTDLNGIIEGIDLAISFSLLPFLSIYFFYPAEQFNSIIYMLLITCLSLFVRPIVIPLVLSLKKKITINHGALYLIIIPFCYLCPIVIPYESFLSDINIVLIIISRLLIGFTFAVNNNIFNEFSSENISKFYNSKYFLFPIIGVFIGLIFSVFLNQLFSNSELSSEGWKLGYIFMITISLSIYFIFYWKKKQSSFLIIEREDLYNNFNFMKVFKTLLENIYFLIPLLFIYFFSMSHWLPRAVLSENTFFLDISLIYIMLILIAAIFLNFIFDLIGKEKVYMYFCIFGIIISLLLFISYSYKSSYAISLLHFFISIISSLSIPLYLINIKKFQKKNNLLNIYFLLNIPFLIISLLIKSPIKF